MDINTKDIKMVAPWTEYANQIEAMFKEDPDIRFDYDDNAKVITLRVNGNEKAEALSQLLLDKKFGNVVVQIRVVPANAKSGGKIELFRKAFEGNPVFSEIVIADTLFGDVSFVVFKPKVVQYYNDAMFDLNGVKTTVYQDLAQEIFGIDDGVFFCTEMVE